MSSLQKGEKGQWLEQETGSSSSLGFLSFFLERERLLSSFPANPTVDSFRDKKESCFTRRGLRVGTRFREFPQTLRGRGFSLVGFYTLFKCFSMFRLS